MENTVNTEDEIKEAFKMIINYMADHKADVMNAKIEYDDNFIVCAKLKIWAEGEGAD